MVKCSKFAQKYFNIYKNHNNLRACYAILFCLKSGYPVVEEFKEGLFVGTVSYGAG